MTERATDRIEELIRSAESLASKSWFDRAGIARTRRAMDRLHPEDLEPDSVGRFSPGRGWSSQCVCSHSRFDIGLFFVPAGQVIPLHDHPFMTVFQRILWGPFEIRAFDWDQRFPWSGLARSTYEITAGGDAGTLLILPAYGNLHTLKALEDGLFLDCVMPPYDESDGRVCHYYGQVGTVATTDGTLTRLEVVDGP